MASFLADARERALGRVRGLRDAAARNLAAKGGGSLASDAPDSAIAGLFGGGSGDLESAFGGNAEAARARAAYNEFRSWVYVCVNAIAGRLSAQPMVAALVPLNDTDSGGGKRATHAADISRRKKVPKLLATKLPTAFSLDILSSGDVVTTISRPNPVQSTSQFLYFSAASLLLTGEAYWIAGVVDDKDADDASVKRVEWWAVPRHWIRPVHGDRLFESYLLQTSPTSTPIPLDASQVARTYFPDPADIKGCRSPLSAVLTSVRVDDRIQASQLQAFERGVDPNLIVTVGRLRDADGKLGERRPRLTGAQRRQLIRAVQEVWDSTVNQGYPAIVDGFIESVHKMSSTPAEMGWTESGDVVKRRIFQAFKVNPIVVGEIVGANRAQVVVAEQHFCGNAVNPIGGAFSEAATKLGRTFFEADRNAALTIYVEIAEPTDPDLEIRRWGEARKNGDVTSDEYRAEMLGLPPLEQQTKRNELLSTVGGITGTVQVVTAVGQGMVRPEQAASILELFLEVPPEVASRIAGVGQAPLPPPPGSEPPAGNGPQPPQDGGDQQPAAGDGGDQANGEASFVRKRAAQGGALTAGHGENGDQSLGPPPTGDGAVPGIYRRVPLTPTPAMVEAANDAVQEAASDPEPVALPQGVRELAQRIASGLDLSPAQWRWFWAFAKRCLKAIQGDDDVAAITACDAYELLGGDATYVRASHVCQLLDAADRRQSRRAKFAGQTVVIDRAAVKQLSARQLDALIGGAAEDLGGVFRRGS